VVKYQRYGWAPGPWEEEEGGREKWKRLLPAVPSTVSEAGPTHPVPFAICCLPNTVSCIAYCMHREMQPHLTRHSSGVRKGVGGCKRMQGYEPYRCLMRNFMYIRGG
jgi:hypothetical protein